MTISLGKWAGRRSCRRLSGTSRGNRPDSGSSHWVSSTASSILTRPDRWTWHGVILEVVIDVHDIPGLIALDETWNRHQWSWSTTSTSSDGDLCTGDIELGNTSRVWIMDGELLNAEQVVSVWQCFGDCVGVCFCISSQQVSGMTAWWIPYERVAMLLFRLRRTLGLDRGS